jgi:predicted transcriptional regulator
MIANRSRTEIISDLVEASRSGAKKTHLMYKGNLSYQVLSQYLRYMIKSDLIREDNGSGERLYFATGKGLKFLDLEKQLSEIASFNNQKKRGIGEAVSTSQFAPATQGENTTGPTFNW